MLHHGVYMYSSCARLYPFNKLPEEAKIEQELHYCAKRKGGGGEQREGNRSKNEGKKTHIHTSKTYTGKMITRKTAMKIPRCSHQNFL